MYEVSEGQALSDGVVRAVAAVTGLRPAVPMDGEVEMDSIMDPLATAVDPDALDTLFDPTDDETTASITFRYQSHTVTVDNTGTVRVILEETDAGPRTRTRVPTPGGWRETAGQ
ncbi:HalOD1 output domain-containing protein [Haloarcula regularis]|uniref:HalOD1 output domain-containing protein n=1 Tax=Haloarcula regularis TaxID=3033392 RepID=UPI0023E7EE24|nr:HalOD1 output domain-containing protein [Halomicroarcula sp. SYNS111]